uniref:Uncharacterized protein n=1 Tax=Arundo donax TaxID=35708 RepID=A0A0A9FRP0_ARUDO
MGDRYSNKDSVGWQTGNWFCLKKGTGHKDE